MPKIGKQLLYATVITGLSGIPAASALELRSLDGFVSLEGELQEFDGTMLTVKTGHGVVKIPASSVVCVSADCPDGVARVEVLEPVEAPGVAEVQEEETTPPRSDELTIAFSERFGEDIFKRLLASSISDDSTPFNLNLGDDGFSVSTIDNSASTAVRFGRAETAQVILRSSGPALLDAQAEARADTWANASGPAAYELNSVPLAVVTDPRSGVDTLSLADLAGIFSGTVANWSELGGNDMAIRPIKVSDVEQMSDAVYSAILSPFQMTLTSEVLNTASAEQSLAALNVIPGGVTVVALEALGSARPVAMRDACSAPVEPTPFDTASGRYPLALSTFASLTSEAAATPVATLFNTLATTSLDRRDGGIPVRVNAGADQISAIMSGELPQGHNDPARSFVQSMIQASRLALTFHGGPISDVTAARNRADFARLKHAILHGQFDGQEIVFTGFSLDRSDPARSISQSKEAAQSLLAAFRSYAPEAAAYPGVTLTSDGFGNISYHNCQAARTSEQTLVEIWTRPS